jgi:hypothetical protein
VFIPVHAARLAQLAQQNLAFFAPRTRTEFGDVHELENFSAELHRRRRSTDVMTSTRPFVM